MKYLLRLSGEHPELPYTELTELLESCGLEYSVRRLEDLWIIVDTECDAGVFARLAYTLRVYEHVGESRDYTTLVGDVYDIISDSKTFRVSSESDSAAKRLGELLYEMGIQVNLKKPDAIVFCKKFGEDYHIGVELRIERDFESRRPQFRPFFSPTSMHPKLARALVNLSGACEGDLLLDPFCGTGGILIEAGLCGVKVAGWDVSEVMAGGCGRNLAHYGISGDIQVRDALEKSDFKCDVIATDPPYGRSSFTTDETKKIFNGFIPNAHGMLPAGGRMVLMAPDDVEIDFREFSVKHKFDVRMHKSLTRRIWILEK
ncbi:MAG TPA: hypothetical protein ENN13_03305 [Candidatus Altiarchaeales archaeon]|mgnify:CR=1 FL=1|nr:hypothetical protein [Candidatus Altiarchaeales archaeon]